MNKRQRKKNDRALISIKAPSVFTKIFGIDTGLREERGFMLKKRIAMFKNHGVSMRLQFDYIDDETFDKALERLALNASIPVKNIFTFTLGDQEEMENGNCYFCPRCGTYNEFAYEPEVHRTYRVNHETKELQEAGYHKSLEIHCNDCDEVWYLGADHFRDDEERLNEIEKNNKA